MEEKDLSHDSQLPQGPHLLVDSHLRDHACDLPFPILDFSTSWVFLWPPSRLTNHWAAPRSPESLVVAPLQDQRKSLETAMETSVVLDRRFGEGVGAGLKQASWSNNLWITVGRPLAVIFPTRGRRRLLLFIGIEVRLAGQLPRETSWGTSLTAPQLRTIMRADVSCNKLAGRAG